MRRHLATVATIAVTALSVPWLDRPSIPLGAVPLAWGLCALALAIELAGVSTVATFARTHRAAASLSVLVAAALMTLVVAGARRSPIPALGAAITASGLSASSLVRLSPEMQSATTELLLALRQASNTHDSQPCEVVLKPGDILGPETPALMSVLLDGSQVRVVPSLARVSTALRALNAIVVERAADTHGSIGGSLLADAYQTLLTRQWVLVREEQRGGVPASDSQTFCAYGLTDVSSKPVMQQLQNDASLRTLP